MIFEEEELFYNSMIYFLLVNKENNDNYNNNDVDTEDDEDEDDDETRTQKWKRTIIRTTTAT